MAKHKTARSAFMELTSSRYNGLVKRCEKLKIPKPEFSLMELRGYLLGYFSMDIYAMRQCRYCHRPMAISDVAIDHETPLSRGGFSELSNIGFPCPDCNQIKGRMLPAEMTLFMEFLEAKLPMARVDILKRLKQAVKLAARVRRDIQMRKAKEAQNQGAIPKPKKVHREPTEETPLFGVQKGALSNRAPSQGRTSATAPDAAEPF